MTVLELVEYTRGEVLRDNVPPYLYDEDALVMYANEGLARMARRTHVFVDEFSIVTEAGTRRYPVKEGTIHVQSVIEPSGRSLTPFTRRTKPRLWEGCPTAYSTDSAQRQITLHPTPDQAYEMLVTRAYTPPRLDLSDEIPLAYDHAVLLADWIAHRALRNNDPDGSNTVAADQFERAWQMGLQEMKRDVIRYAAGDNPSAQPQNWT